MTRELEEPNRVCSLKAKGRNNCKKCSLMSDTVDSPLDFNEQNFPDVIFRISLNSNTRPKEHGL